MSPIRLFIKRNLPSQGTFRRISEVLQVGSIKALACTTGVILIAHISLILLFVRPSASFLPLHYNIFFGIDLVGTWWQFFFFPGIVALLFTGALIVAPLFPRRPLTQTILFSYISLSAFVFFVSTLLVIFQAL